MLSWERSSPTHSTDTFFDSPLPYHITMIRIYVCIICSTINQLKAAGAHTKYFSSLKMITYDLVKIHNHSIYNMYLLFFISLQYLF